MCVSVRHDACAIGIILFIIWARGDERGKKKGNDIMNLNHQPFDA
jgi:hypothetical protein